MYSVPIKPTAIAATIVGCLLLCANSAQAQTTEVVAGGSVVPTPTLPGALGGTLLSSLFSPFDTTFNGQTIRGTVISAVYTNGAVEDGVFGGASYDFYYQIRFTSGNSSITSVNAARFADFRTSLGQISDGDGIGSTFSSGTEQSVRGRRTIDGDGIAFDFLGFVPRESSYTLVVRTDASVFDRNGSIGLLASGVSTSALILAPVGAVDVEEVAAPEPGTLALLGVGLGVVGFARRRRK
jgi:hypothetical protein